MELGVRVALGFRPFVIVSEADQQKVPGLHFLKESLILGSLKIALGAGAGYSQVFYGNALKIPVKLSSPAVAGIIVSSVVKFSSSRISDHPQNGNTGVCGSVLGGAGICVGNVPIGGAVACAGSVFVSIVTACIGRAVSRSGFCSMSCGIGCFLGAFGNRFLGSMGRRGKKSRNRGAEKKEGQKFQGFAALG